jgi:Lsr2
MGRSWLQHQARRSICSRLHPDGLRQVSLPENLRLTDIKHRGQQYIAPLMGMSLGRRAQFLSTARPKQYGFGGATMQKVEVQLEDDLTGGLADETVEFSVGGRAYEIDLSTRHAADFRRRLAPFVEHARLVRPHRLRATVRTAAHRERSRQIRVWAEQQGFALAEHGRLPANVVHEYQTAHGREQPGERPARRASAGRNASSNRSSTKPPGSAGRSLRHGRSTGTVEPDKRLGRVVHLHS